VKFKTILFFSAFAINAFAANGGGDDAGNGGFAYKQSIKILQMASAEVTKKAAHSDMKELVDHPEWKKVLVDTLNYDHLQKLYKKNAYRNGRKLAMDYIVKPASVKILKPYYEAFMGKTDAELDASSLEVQKRLIHEASHIWGYNETQSEDFSVRFLNHENKLDIRPTNKMHAGNFCSCLNGKSDLISDCNDFCSHAPVSSVPTLYLDMTLDPEIILHPKLGNLYNWCNVQLENDSTAPQCALQATDGVTTLNIPVDVNKNSNSLRANISQLSLDRTYIFKLIEIKTGSNAQSTEAQLRRMHPRNEEEARAIKIVPLNQYTCLNFGMVVNGNGGVERTSYARKYYFYAANDLPAPMPPTSGPAPVVCFDEQLHPGDDSQLYPRLETVPYVTALFDNRDPFFLSDGTNLKINKILERRLLNEYDVSANINLFEMIRFPKKPNAQASSVGFIMVPFESNGTSFCPQFSKFKGENPLLTLLGDYMDDTEGLYIAEKEGEVLKAGPNSKTVFATIFLRETLLKKYGFTIENGVKVRVSDLHNKPVFIYWPISDSMDPLIQGSRKLFTIKRPDELQEENPSFNTFAYNTSDKKIGCVVKYSWEKKK
jgi:hypothetical protein